MGKQVQLATNPDSHQKLASEPCTLNSGKLVAETNDHRLRCQY